MTTVDLRSFCTPIKDQGYCGCYDDQTEVLTSNGWKFWKDVKTDAIMCFNPKTKRFEYHKPIRLFIYDYNGKMIKIACESVDLVVTPNHNMLIRSSDNEEFSFVRADSLPEHFQLVSFDGDKESDIKIISMVRDSTVSEINYKGTVYCAEVPTHAMVVRRNGIPVVSGNSCCSFGLIGALEEHFVRFTNQAYDLSEKHLFFCSGGRCEEGNTLENTLNRALQGIAIEDDLPYCDVYSGKNYECGTGLPQDWYIRGKKIKSWRKITDKVEMRVALSSGRALYGCMEVYQSFMNYQGGVYYKLPYDQFLGRHAIAIVGFSDEKNAWLCRNSWGTGWGEDGYFWIQYGECHIDDFMFDFEISEEPPSPDVNPSPCIVGNFVAKMMNILPRILKRKGRFYYLNPNR